MRTIGTERMTFTFDINPPQESAHYGLCKGHPQAMAGALSLLEGIFI